MLSDRKDALRKEIERKEAYLAKLEALPDFEAVVDGTVMVLAVTLGSSKPYTYAALKTAGKWYLTGTRSPNGITGDELAEWLVTQGRRFIGATVVAEVKDATTEVVNLGELLGQISEAAGQAFIPRKIHDYGSRYEFEG